MQKDTQLLAQIYVAFLSNTFAIMRIYIIYLLFWMLFANHDHFSIS